MVYIIVEVGCYKPELWGPFEGCEKAEEFLAIREYRRDSYGDERLWKGPRDESAYVRFPRSPNKSFTYILAGSYPPPPCAPKE